MDLIWKIPDILQKLLRWPILIFEERTSQKNVMTIYIGVDSPDVDVYFHFREYM